jgi:glutathione S-transferase
MLQLFSHPFSSYCQKVLVALWENDVPFTSGTWKIPRRPSFARAVEEGRPYRSYFPLGAPDRD